MFLDDNRGIEFDSKQYETTKKHEIYALTQKGKNQYYDSQIRRLKKIPKDFMEAINNDVNGYKFENAELEKKKWEEEKKIKEEKEKEIQQELKNQKNENIIINNQKHENKKIKKPIPIPQNISNSAVGRVNNNLMKVSAFEDNSSKVKIDKDFLAKFQKKNLKIRNFKG
jgi:hypothetical protein